MGAVTTASRFGPMGGGGRGSGVGGEIIEVQGGHIVRSMGRKDRHSKVCTAKGPRDRRVRLSAHTAIQFYDVQDRLGYDRPSKAVDWLIKKAKAAIDELAQLPAWKPTAAASPTTATNDAPAAEQETLIDFRQPAALDPGGGNGLRNLSRQHGQMAEIEKQSNDAATASSFLPPSLDSDTIADTIKSFFPMGVSGDQSVTSSSSMQFHGYPPDLISRTSSQSQDLRLSLQSFQEQPVLLRPHHSQTNEHHHHQPHQVVLEGTAHHQQQLGFDSSLSSASAASMWLSDHLRISQWNSSGSDGGISNASGGGGFMFGSAVTPMPTLFGQQGQLFQQRGPLQSSHMASVRAWIDPTAIPSNDHQMMPGVGFAMGGYSGYSNIPARIRGQEEEMHDGILDRPSSASSDSHSRH